MNYYRDQVTQKSWSLLQELAQKYKFLLIGGWAVWLHTHGLKSKDIDIIVNFDQLDKLRQDFDLIKNDRLKKYEIAREEIQIDIYVPHYSQLGTDINKIISQSVKVDGFTIPNPETLVILKQVAYFARRGSSKGHKDLVDIIGLLSLPQFDWKKYSSIGQPADLQEIISSQSSLPELDLNSHKYSRLKKLWLKKLC